MKTILITGGTGFVGSFLSMELLKRGNFVIFLVRSKGMFSAKERVDAILKFVNPSLFESLKPFYRVLEGDVTKEELGLSRDGMDALLGAGVSAIFHSAGAIDFVEEKKENTWSVNVGGTKNVLAFATKANIRQFHHLSTLYVAGDRNGEALEDELFVGQSFNNPYEGSKAEAERLVQEWAKTNSSSYKIYRLPIVLGDSREGKTLTFTGFYGFFKPFWVLKKILKERMKTDPRLEEAGIRFENDHVLAPLFIKCAGRSRIDLVPIDWVVKNICLLSREEVTPNVFHLSHPFAPSSAKVIKETLPLIGLKGLKLVLVNGHRGNYKHNNNVLDAYQKMVDMITDQYFAYNVNMKVFVDKNVVRFLGRDYYPPPRINVSFLKVVLNYAMEKEFRKFSLA